jgi:hypothetical protein
MWKRSCTFALAALLLGAGVPVFVIAGPGTAGAAERTAGAGQRAPCEPRAKARSRKGGGNKNVNGGGSGSRVRPGKPPAARSPRTPDPAPAEPADRGATADAPAPPPPPAAAERSGEGGPARAGKPRVYTFGGMDLEGKLKTPQLLYFRGRMRQELDASSLQRRSFMQDLEKTADDQGL